MKNALLSVNHKEGIVEFAHALIELGFTIYASGGTYAHLHKNNVVAFPVSNFVGGEAILGHRVVTLSREIHAGLLATDSDEDKLELATFGIPRIDLVCVDLYPLQDEIERKGSDHNSVTAMTDIGGPTLIRSAVKGGRIVICDPQDRQQVIDWLKVGELDDGFIEYLCAKGEQIVVQYCVTSANYLRSRLSQSWF
jgi:phosphoribosylaminoimidazolecarboxamide formyltransferase/IMP cyclohydrolase